MRAPPLVTMPQIIKDPLSGLALQRAQFHGVLFTETASTSFVIRWRVIAREGSLVAVVISSKVVEGRACCFSALSEAKLARMYMADKAPPPYRFKKGNRRNCGPVAFRHARRLSASASP